MIDNNQSMRLIKKYVVHRKKKDNEMRCIQKREAKIFIECLLKYKLDNRTVSRTDSKRRRGRYLCRSHKTIKKRWCFYRQISRLEKGWKQIR